MEKMYTTIKIYNYFEHVKKIVGHAKLSETVGIIADTVSIYEPLPVLMKDIVL